MCSRKTLACAVLAGLLVLPAIAAPVPEHLQSLIIRSAAQTRRAVDAIYFWPKDFPREGGGVVGTAFFVSERGYFLTAGHVISSFPPGSGTLTVAVRQVYPTSGMIGEHFVVVGRDSKHDIALCRTLDGVPFAGPRPRVGGKRVTYELGTLRLDPRSPAVGTLVLVVGFPLGSWAPDAQLGMVSATETVNPALGVLPGGLEIGVAANKGNSGSPVVDLETGRVVGIIDRAVPAPLFAPEAGLPFAQSSGIVLAVPSRWAVKLLERYGVLPAQRR